MICSELNLHHSLQLLASHMHLPIDLINPDETRKGVNNNTQSSAICHQF